MTRVRGSRSGSVYAVDGGGYVGKSERAAVAQRERFQQRSPVEEGEPAIRGVELQPAFDAGLGDAAWLGEQTRRIGQHRPQRGMSVGHGAGVFADRRQMAPIRSIDGGLQPGHRGGEFGAGGREDASRGADGIELGDFFRHGFGWYGE